LKIATPSTHRRLRVDRCDRWVSVGPMVAMAREQSHSVGIAAHNQTIAVVFDFM
jgi:hypothetical protein